MLAHCIRWSIKHPLQHTREEADTSSKAHNHPPSAEVCIHPGSRSSHVDSSDRTPGRHSSDAAKAHAGLHRHRGIHRHVHAHAHAHIHLVHGLGAALCSGGGRVVPHHRDDFLARRSGRGGSGCRGLHAGLCEGQRGEGQEGEGVEGGESFGVHGCGGGGCVW